MAFARRSAAVMRALAKRCQHLLWDLRVRLSRPVAVAVRQKATVIIPTYSAERAGGVAFTVRAVLRCPFVETLIVSNHNPDIRIETYVRSQDPRLVLLNQPTRRGCGYQWDIAASRAPEFLISIDDDIRLLPSQLALLFERLVADPQRPHGLMGSRDEEFFENREMEVGELNQVYAITAAQLRVYLALVAALTSRGLVTAETIEFWGDDILISRTGTRPPRIHAAGRVLRCATASDPRVAIHKQAEFRQRRSEVWNALKQVPTPATSAGGDVAGLRAV